MRDAGAAGRRAADFFSFGEVATGDTDATLLSEFSTLGALDASLDFPLAIAARDFVGRGGPAAGLAAVFHDDDRYTDHDSTARALPTFLGNHDQGRFAYFLRQLDPAADDARLLALSKLGHALLFLVRGQPVVYYGDEQGMIGRYGHDMQARESVFASRAPGLSHRAVAGDDADSGRTTSLIPSIPSIVILRSWRASGRTIPRWPPAR
jgi:glycosidase